MSDTQDGGIISPDYLIALVREAAEKRADIAEIAGSLGARVKEAAENGNLHRGAFAVMVRLNKMEEQKRNDWIRSFNVYAGMCQSGLWGGSHVGDLDDMARASSAEDDQMRRNGELVTRGIKELPSDAPDGKPKRGRAKKATEAPPTAPEAFEDDAESDKPSVAQNERREALAGGDAPGTYVMKH